MIDFLNDLFSMVAVKLFVVSNREAVLGLCVTSHGGQADRLAGRDSFNLGEMRK